jgi:hypothetical protein
MSYANVTGHVVRAGATGLTRKELDAKVPCVVRTVHIGEDDTPLMVFHGDGIATVEMKYHDKQWGYVCLDGGSKVVGDLINVLRRAKTAMEREEKADRAKALEESTQSK